MNGLVLGIYIAVLIIQVHTILMHLNISKISKSLDEVKRLLKGGADNA